MHTVASHRSAFCRADYYISVRTITVKDDLADAARKAASNFIEIFMKFLPVFNLISLKDDEAVYCLFFYKFATYNFDFE